MKAPSGDSLPPSDAAKVTQMVVLNNPNKVGLPDTLIQGHMSMTAAIVNWTTALTSCLGAERVCSMHFLCQDGQAVQGTAFSSQSGVSSNPTSDRKHFYTQIHVNTHASCSQLHIHSHVCKWHLKPFTHHFIFTVLKSRSSFLLNLTNTGDNPLCLPVRISTESVYETVEVRSKVIVSKSCLHFQVNLKMRIRICYTIRGTTVQDTIQIDSFPTHWQQPGSPAGTMKTVCGWISSLLSGGVLLLPLLCRPSCYYSADVFFLCQSNTALSQEIAATLRASYFSPGRKMSLVKQTLVFRLQRYNNEILKILGGLQRKLYHTSMIQFRLFVYKVMQLILLSVSLHNSTLLSA